MITGLRALARRNLTITMVWSLVGLKKFFFVKSLLLRIRLSTGKTLSPNSNFCLRNRFQKFSMDFSDFFGALYKSIYYPWHSNFPWLSMDLLQIPRWWIITWFIRDSLPIIRDSRTDASSISAIKYTTTHASTNYAILPTNVPPRMLSITKRATSTNIYFKSTTTHSRNKPIL